MDALKSTLSADSSGAISGAWWDHHNAVITSLQLDIETYYLFSKILLDKVAHFIEFFFGTQRGASLDSHDQLTKHFNGYCNVKDLTDFESLLKQLPVLKKDISDFRDYQVAHEKSPRTIRGFGFTENRETAMIVSRLYPKESDVPVQSKNLYKLHSDIEGYLKNLVEFVQTNRRRSKLTRQ